MIDPGDESLAFQRARCGCIELQCTACALQLNDARISFLSLHREPDQKHVFAMGSMNGWRPLDYQFRAGPHDMLHMRRVVGHVSGWQEYTNYCACGEPWPCPRLPKL